MTEVFQKNALKISVIFSVVFRVNYKEIKQNGIITNERSGAYDCRHIKSPCKSEPAAPSPCGDAIHKDLLEV
jgi:hypothetical protein